jgi:hypothetical protein
MTRIQMLNVQFSILNIQMQYSPRNYLNIKQVHNSSTVA